MTEPTDYDAWMEQRRLGWSKMTEAERNELLEGDIATRITDLVDLSRREHDSKPVCTRRLQVNE